ncbi:MAG: ABC transporter permease [Candidatus Dormibacteria bacterium]
MSTLVMQPSHMAVRYLRALWRQPWYLAMQLFQPLIWLLLFGQLFQSVTRLPGFGSGSYLGYLTPGVLVMSSLFANGWSGTSYIVDMERGVLDRLLVAPARRTTFLLGQQAYYALLTAIQSAILLLVALLAGARFHGGLPSILALVAAAVLLGLSMACLSNAMALRLRQQETVIAANVFLVLPLCFLSSLFLPSQLLPKWIQVVASFNPVNWAVEAGRQSLNAGVDWGLVLSRLGLLALLALVLGWWAVRSFRAYQRSV